MVIRREALAPPLVSLIALAGYTRTVMPGVGYWDTAEFQTVGPILGIAHPTGFPTYVVLSWLANAVLVPLGEPALRMNVLSAILVAAAAGVTVVLARRLTGSAPIGVAAGFGLAATPIAWGITTHADPHTLHLLLVAVLFVLLVGWEDARTAGSPHADRWLVAATVVFGLSLGNHSLTLLLALPVALFVHAIDPRIWRRRISAICAAALVMTLVLVYLELPIRGGVFPAPLVYGSPDTLEGFLYIVSAEQFRGSFADHGGGLIGAFGRLVELGTAQFGPLVVLIPVGFVATLARRPRYALLSGLAFVITVLFSAFYVNADIARYYLGAALIAWTWLALLAGTVVEHLVASAAPRDDDEDLGARADPAEPGPALGFVTAIVALALLAPTALGITDRAAAIDRSRDPGARPWLDASLAAIAPDGVIVSWWSYSTALWYAQVIEGRRPDIWIVDDRTRLDQNLGDVIDVIDANLDTRPVYLVRADPAEIERLREIYVIDGVGDGLLSNVFRVAGRVGGAG